jgi:hypothetical protein
LIAAHLGDLHEQYVWRFLRAHKIDLAGLKSWCESGVTRSLPPRPLMWWGPTGATGERREYSSAHKRNNFNHILTPKEGLLSKGKHGRHRLLCKRDCIYTANICNLETSLLH